MLYKQKHEDYILCMLCSICIVSESLRTIIVTVFTKTYDISELQA